MLVLNFTILPFGVLVLLLADRWRQAAANERHASGRERAPRSMGVIFFQKNERHAAWERSCRSRAPKITQDKKMTFLHQKN